MCVRLLVHTTVGFFGISLMSLPERNLQFSEKLTHMGQRTTRSKVMFYLSAEAQRLGKYEFDIPFSRQQLADYLGVERSGLSPELGKMKKRRTPRLSQKPFHFECTAALNLPHGFSCRKACMNKALRQYCIQSEKP